MTTMSHRQLSAAAPALCAQTDAALPVPTHGHRSSLNHLGTAPAEPATVTLLIAESKYSASYLIHLSLAAFEGDAAVVRITKPCSDAVHVRTGQRIAFAYSNLE